MCSLWGFVRGGCLPWALVGDHGGDFVTVGAGYADAHTAGVAVVPVGVGERGAVETGGDGVADERAHSALSVSAVESGFAALGGGR